MKKPRLTRAEQLARHRKIFLLARERDVALVEAEQLLAREEWAAAQERLRVVTMCGRGQGKSVATEAALTAAAEAGFRVLDLRGRPIPDDAPWMMRD
ncbi:hypothetical protein [Sphingopyxis sp. GW247-27LB]|uniref:hypothetical protein n=1 Tax=Sphingopyxis sp. GW247-27LB TaxID=2012632 RepID=UPI000BA7AF26|nr:hypothetical protein [Sphingopyxis sp. GW247-27LB]PAL25510.1 hypothetical protein CD928_03280 [Sphingopyxis sp. GW247-27LB]